MRYKFEIYYWGEWSLEQEFHSFDRAKNHASNFSQDEWRIVGSNGTVLCEHNALNVLEELERQAGLDVSRFARSDEFVARMHRQQTAPQQSRLQPRRPMRYTAPKPMPKVFDDKVNWLLEGF